MSLDQAAPAERDLLRRQARWLSFWVLLAGLSADLVLRYGIGMASLGLRYALVAAVMYGTFLVGGWWLARRWRLQAHRLRRTRIRRSDHWEKKSRTTVADWMDWPGGVLGEGWMLLIAVAFLWLAWWALGLAMAEMLAGYLAETLLGFAIGAVFYQRWRRIKPQPLSAYWGFMFRRTALYAVFAVVLAGGLGLALQAHAPQAQTLLQALTARRPA